MGVIAGVVVIVLMGAGYLLGERDASMSAALPLQQEKKEAEPERLSLPPDIELADTPAKQEKGLSGRPLIADDYGMLFVFPRDGKHGFWMKDMLQPIDMVWITKDGVIASIDHSVSPETYPTIFMAPVPTRYVLETRAGYAKAHGWEAGKRIELGAYAIEE